MSEYWMGVGSVPAVVLGVGAAYLAWLVLVWVVGHLGALSLLRVTPATKHRQRARIGGVVYASERMTMLTHGKFAVVFIAGGVDGAKAREATELLDPPIDVFDLVRGPADDGADQ